AELVDAPDLGSGAARCESSSLSFRTIIKKARHLTSFFSIYSSLTITLVESLKVSSILLISSISSQKSILLLSILG
uniref:hypothetical protein n=1 Tax=Vibrio sp. CyArs1 TaxID=2682577 RepID=UPI001F05DB89